MANLGCLSRPTWLLACSSHHAVVIMPALPTHRLGRDFKEFSELKGSQAGFTPPDFSSTPPLAIILRVGLALSALSKLQDTLALQLISSSYTPAHFK